MMNSIFDDDYVRELFNRMGPTYDAVNLISSFGFSEFWRLCCIQNANIEYGNRVCDMMAGTGECWRYALDRGASLISVDFSPAMAARQIQRRGKLGKPIDVRCENALQTSLDSESVDCVICAFGLKTLNRDSLRKFALELHRILKPGGRISLLEISNGNGWWLSGAYRWYVNVVIPLVGKLLLGDIECYRMLGIYTCEFGSCEKIANITSVRL